MGAPAPMTHDELRRQLTGYVAGLEGFRAFEELGIGQRDARVDVLGIKISYWRGPTIRIYEVKASRADFLRDTGAQKYLEYWPLCHQLYFACEAGLLKKADLPEGCGLIVRGAAGWRVVAPPKTHEPTGWPGWYSAAWQSVMIHQHFRLQMPRDLGTADAWRGEDGVRLAANRAGRQLAQRLTRLDEREKTVDRAWAVMSEALGVDPADGWRARDLGWLRSDFEDLRASLGRILGRHLPPGWVGDWRTLADLAQALDRLRPQTAGYWEQASSVLDAAASVLVTLARADVQGARRAAERAAKALSVIVDPDAAADDQPA